MSSASLHARSRSSRALSAPTASALRRKSPWLSAENFTPSPGPLGVPCSVSCRFIAEISSVLESMLLFDGATNDAFGTVSRSLRWRCDVGIVPLGPAPICANSTLSSIGSFGCGSPAALGSRAAVRRTTITATRTTKTMMTNAPAPTPMPTTAAVLRFAPPPSAFAAALFVDAGNVQYSNVRRRTLPSALLSTSPLNSSKVAVLWFTATTPRALAHTLVLSYNGVTRTDSMVERFVVLRTAMTSQP
mmetsp:Transcript_21702/g.67384  ORF Transcript_21702/g.67384 Transcript_21702/m.67384 type:complete len:246 (+) Transcript_21702:440-1177(+)